jgi:hypothetical protein
MVIFRNPNGWERTLSDGAYAWEPSQGDLDYLNLFYSRSNLFPAQQTMGGISPSFNDSLAAWSDKRYVDARCGQTWLKKAAAVNEHWSASNQLKLLQIATWNDYEEGSTIESGIDNCLDVHASANGSAVSWWLSGNGNENTVSHFTVFVSQDGKNLMPVVDLPLEARSFDLSQSGLERGAYIAYVKAIGKPSLLNHMSKAVPVTVTNSGISTGADYALTTSSAKVSVRADKPASVEVKLQPKNGFTDNVSFSCSGLPSWAQCEFSPQTLQASGGSSASTTLMIRTTQLAASAPAPTGSLGVMLFSVVLGICSTKKSRKLPIVASIALVAIWMIACGGGGVGETSSSSSSSKVMVIATPAKRNLPVRSIELHITRK